MQFTDVLPWNVWPSLMWSFFIFIAAQLKICPSSSVFPWRILHDWYLASLPNFRALLFRSTSLLPSPNLFHCPFHTYHSQTQKQRSQNRKTAPLLPIASHVHALSFTKTGLTYLPLLRQRKRRGRKKIAILLRMKRRQNLSCLYANTLKHNCSVQLPMHYSHLFPV